MSDDFPERLCHEEDQDQCWDSSERIMCVPSLQREFGIYGKYMNCKVRGGDEENNKLEVFREHFPQ
jgi:hypothetical protein